MEMRYVSKGLKGHTCEDCMQYKPVDDPTKGTCFGHSIDAEGSCNFFRKKK